jgi:oligopeptide/dipeptide ABC transporter ATP-binding protein
LSTPPLLCVTGLTKYFPVKASSFTGPAGAQLRAVHNVSFSLDSSRSLGLVGESGCGKSTTGRLVLRLIEPSAGRIELDGRDITRLGSKDLKSIRRRMQIVFQDPLGSLNPRLTVRRIVGEPLVVHGTARTTRNERVAELLREVELPPEAAHHYPHEFSGGQRQRIAIARALAVEPDLIVADEPVSALDASIQAQILALMKRLQVEQGIAYLFISHDLAVVRFLCHDVAVMYLGEIVEQGPIAAVYEKPRHPYTQALLAAIPRAKPRAESVQPLAGQLPSAITPPDGCTFATRCPHATNRCRQDAPPKFAISDGHHARCWLNDPASPTSV